MQSDVPGEPLCELLVRFPVVGEDHVWVSGDEPLPEIDMIILRKSWDDRGILQHLSMPRGSRAEQNFAGLPDCSDREPIELLLGRRGSELFFVRDNDREYSADRCWILPELSNPIKREKTVV